MRIHEGLSETTRALLRIVSGLMLWQHGAQKLFGWLGGNAVASWLSWPVGIAGIIEFFGGLLIILGVKTRWVAFLLSGHLAVVFWWRHFPWGEPQNFMPIMNRGEVPVLFCFIFLYLWTAGPGRWSVDDLLAKRSRPPDA